MEQVQHRIRPFRHHDPGHGFIGQAGSRHQGILIMEGGVIILTQGCGNAPLGFGRVAVLEFIPGHHQHFPAGFRQGPGRLEPGGPGPDHQDIRLYHRRLRRIKTCPIGFHKESSFCKGLLLWQQPVTGHRSYANGRNPIDGFPFIACGAGYLRLSTHCQPSHFTSSIRSRAVRAFVRITSGTTIRGSRVSRDRFTSSRVVFFMLGHRRFPPAM